MSASDNAAASTPEEEAPRPEGRPAATPPTGLPRAEGTPTSGVRRGDAPPGRGPRRPAPGARGRPRGPRRGPPGRRPPRPGRGGPRPRPRPRPGPAPEGAPAPDLAHYRYRDTSTDHPPGAPSEPYAGSHIGPCRVLELLGEGSAGRVYRAHHERLDFEVAVKVITPGQHARGKALERFTREARVSARLNHPNVVRVYDVNEADAVHFIIQELVRGESIEARVQRSGPIEIMTVVSIGADLASGLASIHAAGIVHRDVKPANVILTASGDPKLIDFGIAKDTEVSSGTHQDVMLGTPRFMSPEQAAGENKRVGPPADLYGLGATLYFAISGRAPYEPEEDEPLMAFLQRRLHSSAPRLAELCPTIHPELARLVDRLLDAEPGERPSAEEAHALLSGLGEAMIHATGRWKRSAASRLAMPVPVLAEGAAGTQGTFDDLPLTEILQGIEFNAKTGELEIHGGGVTGLITFKDGEPYEATTSDGRRGEVAIRRLLELDTGNFLLRRDAEVQGPRQIPMSFTRLLLDHSRHSDESGRLPIEVDEQSLLEESGENGGSEEGGLAEEEQGPVRSATLRLHRTGKIRRRSTQEIDKAVAALLARAWPQPAGDPYTGCELGPFEVERLIEIERGERRYLARHKPTEAQALLRVFPLFGRRRQEHKALSVRAAGPLTVKDPQLEPCLAAGTSKDAFYVGYRPVERRTLAEALALRDDPFPAAEVVRVIGAVGLALQALHSRSLVHGHVSPSTIRLEPSKDGGPPDVLLCEAGLARTPRAHRFLAVEREAPGAPGYTAPEVLDRGHLTPAADVYSLGCVAWTMLAGHHPLAGRDDLHTIIGQAQADLPPVRRDDASLPQELVTLVTKLTGRNPIRRYANANDFLTDLSAYERGKAVLPFRQTGVESRPDASLTTFEQRRRSSGRKWKVAFYLFLLVNVGLLCLALHLHNEARKLPLEEVAPAFVFELAPGVDGEQLPERGEGH